MWRVLIVGGEGARGATLRERLHSHGYDVCTASTVTAAQRLATESDVAIVAMEGSRIPAAELDLLVERLGRRMPVMVVPEQKRVRAPLARCRCGEVDVDFANYRAMRAGCEVDLSPREFELLRYLAERPDRVVSREELLRGVWGSSAATITRTVDVHIAKLRRKIGDVSTDPRIIATIHRAGYRFMALNTNIYRRSTRFYRFLPAWRSFLR